MTNRPTENPALFKTGLILVGIRKKYCLSLWYQDFVEVVYENGKIIGSRSTSLPDICSVVFASNLPQKLRTAVDRGLGVAHMV